MSFDGFNVTKQLWFWIGQQVHKLEIRKKALHTKIALIEVSLLGCEKATLSSIDTEIKEIMHTTNLDDKL